MLYMEKKFFNLDDKFNLEQLRDARDIKINNIMKSNINDKDKKLYQSLILSKYKQLKYKLEYDNKINNKSSNIFSNMNILNNLQTSNQYISQQSNISKKSLPDGSVLVNEMVERNVNGMITKNINSYKILPSGEKVMLIQNHKN